MDTVSHYLTDQGDKKRTNVVIGEDERGPVKCD